MAAVAQPDATNLQTVMETAVENDGFAAILVSISRDDETRILSAGLADLDANTVANGAEHFRIGSVTKLFTATAVLQLSQQGKLSLSDTVQQHLPGVLPPELPPITIQQLLEHTSGFSDYEAALGFDDSANVIRDRARSWTTQELIAFALEQPLAFSPGESWLYSSTNYILLGEVIEAVTGEPYARAIETGILAPLQLEDTSFPGDNMTIPEPYLRGYTPNIEGENPALADISEWNASVAGAAGEMISTTADLDRYIEGLMKGDLLARESLQAMLRPVPTLPEGLPPGTGSGLGISFSQTSCGKTIYGGGGAVPGYITSVFATRDASERVVIAFTLKTTMAQANQMMIFQLVDLAFCGQS
jgi:D-alanyl-D-alanine carboxypeptidase